MKYYLYLVTIIVISITNYSCNDICTKRVDCHAFDGTLLYSWFPYNEKDKTFYFSDGNDTDTLIIDEIDNSTAYKLEYNSRYGEEKHCDIKGNIKSLAAPKFNGGIPLDITHYESDVDLMGFEYLEISFKKSRFYLWPEDGGFKKAATTSGFSKEHSLTSFDVINLNNKTYNNVILVTLVQGSTTTYNIDKVYIAKGQGVIGYRTYPDQKEYWLQ
ncbi:MAG: hypothetical protein R2800_13075 [Flavipsychrobacter sp.]